MKNIIKSFFLIAVVLMITTSCNKFLEKNPGDVISSGTFWKTEEDVQKGLSGVYSRLRGGYYSYTKVFLEGYSDNGYTRLITSFLDMSKGVVNSTNVPSAFFTGPYNGIASCNYFLENIDNAPVSTDLKNKVKGEVRFLRALFYFDLVQAYGGVPLYKVEPNTVEEAKIAASPKADVLAFVHEDLDFAISNLPDIAYTGHAVKGSAMALKGKVLLFEQKWNESANILQQVINGGKFSINSSYSDLFITATQRNNPEIMFSTMYLAPNSTHSGSGEGLETEVGWYGAVTLYQTLADEYECIDGKPISSSPLFNPDDPYINRDPRMDITLKLPGEKFINPNGSEQTYPEQQTPFVMQKYLDLTHLPFSRDISAVKTDVNIIHIRYADVLLMYAEAKNEATGPDATVYDAINKVRQRLQVNLPPVDETIYNSQDALREYIRHERRVEFACEGLRYFDLKRWNIMDEKLKAVFNPPPYVPLSLSFGEKNNVLPFPQSELERNPQLEQNKDY
ncbi:RagB/SusD family nutrient uptake outer membrane protein [Flavihumibacter sp. UBA7668]|uniref:RagB/SusD family nutrient uptake outer membrane protein n=1 Tax=Flavihumibacter sp. UBA7668 TaxID=1946542 RepID=UPI0025BAA515|nr:RagB/SusD family nutrient uptake outer membrane protein [Flavihumibacter sp. UBA7668]